jgi:hypothetical protein
MRNRLVYYFIFGLMAASGTEVAAQIPYGDTVPGYGAYIERVTPGSKIDHIFLVPPGAEVIIITPDEDVFTVIKAPGSGKVTAAIALPDANTGPLRVFYGDGAGISSSIPFEIMRNERDICCHQRFTPSPRTKIWAEIWVLLGRVTLGQGSNWK